ncbi:MAG: 2,3-bisphosphoglycerate-independent phosphoglycerate mutase [Candidatus Ranarchaeia archaeon]|jgi:2,3-bisphosphoglycerate-independent phosphoglycerate mutase
MALKAILVILDGIGDIPYKKLGGKTVLEATPTKNLDRLAEMGITGMCHSIDYGRTPGSDTAHLALLGYDPCECYFGRGAFEAMGADMDLSKSSVAFRTNFATVDDDLRVLDRRAGRNIPEAQDIAKVVNQVKLKTAEDVRIEFKATTEHRGVLILHGENLSREVSDVDPHQVGERIHDAKPLTDEPSAVRTANILNELTYSIHRALKDLPLNDIRKQKGDLPVNVVLARGAGQLPDVKPLNEIYGIKTGFIAGTALIKGVCRAVGMEQISVEGVTGSYDTNFKGKALGAIRGFKKYDFILLHVKATDNASHDKNIELKQEMISKADEMIGLLLEQLDLDVTTIAVTGDHTTPCRSGDHTGEPCPLAIYSPLGRVDAVQTFGERACTQGGLGHVIGSKLTPILMNFIRRMPKFGA